MFQKPKDTLQLVVHESDIPSVDQGSLIPPSFTPQAVLQQDDVVQSGMSAWQIAGRTALVGCFALLFLFAGTLGFGYVASQGQVASPVVSVIDPVSLEVTALPYGPQAALTQGTFYSQTRDAFVSDEMTFIEIDLVRDQLRYFVDGVLLLNTPIVSPGTAGSWWETTAGLYRVTDRSETEFSSFSQTEFPWVVQFEENFMIHGVPVYPDGSAVTADDVAVGGVQVETAVAKRLHGLVHVGTPILVHTESPQRDTFVYETPAPEVTANHYFVADIETGAVLASSDIEAVAAIASLTKLMTAVVAAEELQLDTRVRTGESSFVVSLIPRLESRASVSMYSLLQLLLAESSNEAAETIAAQLGREEFIAAMNAKARQLGMYNTTFTDPSGLDNGNKSSVGDLYRLTQYIHESRSFIFDITRDVNLPSSYQGGDFSGLLNFNEIEDVTGFAGGKIGETRAAGQTSVSLHELDIDGVTRTVVVVVLGSEARTADVQTLVGFVESQFGS